MGKIKYRGGDGSRRMQPKALGVVWVSFVVILGLSACRTGRSISDQGAHGNLREDNTSSMAHGEGQVAARSIPHLQTNPTGTPLISIDKLQQSDWWASVQKNIRDSEYRVTYQKKTYLPDVKEAYQAAIANLNKQVTNNKIENTLTHLDSILNQY